MFAAVWWCLLGLTGLSLVACVPEDSPPLPGALHVDPPTPLPPEVSVTPVPTLPEMTEPEVSAAATDAVSPTPALPVTPTPGATPVPDTESPDDTREPSPLPTPTPGEVTSTPQPATEISSPTPPPQATQSPVPSDEDGDGWARGDCDDTDASVYPGAPEIPYDGIDQDCEGGDEVDLDNDGAAATVVGGGDCNDLNSQVAPGVVETCDAVDQDCDAAIDDGAGQSWFVDGDGDGWGARGSVAVVSCLQPRGYVANAQDCDDTSSLIYPGSVEVANGKDDDCDGYIDEDLVPSSCREVGLENDKAKSGVYVIDPDGAGPAAAQQVYCELNLAGGGWQLLSTRYRDASTLFSDTLCLNPEVECSGHLPEVQLKEGATPEVLVTRVDGKAWLILGGLSPSGEGGLVDFMSLALPITELGSCSDPSYCGEARDEDLHVVETSGFIPHSWELRSQQVRYGGFWMGDGGTSGDYHTVSFNYVPYCGKPGGIDLSSNEDEAGDMACGDPGALYFRYP